MDRFESALTRAVSKRAFWPVATITACGLALFFWGLFYLDFGRMGAAVLIYVPGFIILARMVWFSAGGTRVVIWLRRFHKREPSRFPLPSLFRNVGFASFQVATIQDTRFKYSFLAGVTRSLFTIIPMVLILGIPSVLIAWGFSIRILGIQMNEQTSMWVFMESLLLAAPIFVLLCYPPLGLFIYLRARWRGVERLRTSTAHRKISRWSGRIKGGNAPPIVGMKVFKCDDDCWRDAVTTALGESDAVVIDVSDLNDNVKWELKQSAEIVGPERIVAVYAVDPARYPENPTDAIVDEIIDVVGSDSVSKMWFWSYPEPLPLKRGRARIGLELRSNLEDTLEQTLEEVFSVRTGSEHCA